MLCWSNDSSAPSPDCASAARTRARRYSCRRRKLTRSSKSTWVWPGACSGRFQLWCGSMSSGLTIVGSAGFFGLAIRSLSSDLLAECEVCHAGLPADYGCLLRLDPRGLDQLRVGDQLVPDHRLEIGQRHAQG